MDVKLDSEEMRSVISEALLRAIDTKTRADFLAKCVQQIADTLATAMLPKDRY